MRAAARKSTLSSDRLARHRHRRVHPYRRRVSYRGLVAQEVPMIEILETCHRRARMAAVERNGGRQVFIVSVFRIDGSDRMRFVFRNSSTRGCN